MRRIDDDTVRFYVQDAQEYLVQLLFALGYSASKDTDYSHAPIDDGISQYVIGFGWSYGHGGSLNIHAGAHRKCGEPLHIYGRAMYNGWASILDRDTFRLLGMKERDRYGSEDVYAIATAVESFLRAMLPQANWQNHYGTCQSSFHNSGEFLLTKHGGRWLCDTCTAALSLNAPVYHRTGETNEERSERDKMTPSLRWDILERDRFTCQSCGRTPPDVKLHVDHKIPIAMGGKTVIENLHTLCAECNLGKSAKMPSQATMEFWEQVHP